MSSPTKEELPKIDENLKIELISEHHLKHTTVKEKIVLPTTEGSIVLKKLILSFDQL